MNAEIRKKVIELQKLGEETRGLIEEQDPSKAVDHEKSLINNIMDSIYYLEIEAETRGMRHGGD